MTSSQPVATPNALNFTPDNKNFYSYSGAIASSAGNFVTMLEFTTQSETLVGQIVFSGPILASDPGNGSDGNFKLSMNGAEILIINFGTSAEDMQSYSVTPVIIPPFTTVKIEYLSADGSRTGYANLVGEAIGMTDVGYQ